MEVHIHHGHATTCKIFPRNYDVVSPHYDVSRSCRFSHGTAQLSFFWVHREWIWEWDKQIVWTAKQFLGDLFVPCSEILTMNPEKRHSFLIIPSQQRWRWYSNTAVRGWLGEWVGSCVREWVRNALPCGHEFLPNHFQTSHAHLPWWEEEPYWFWVTGSKVKVNFGKVNFGTPYIKPCGHDSDYSFCPITFKLHMHICHDERRKPIDFGSRGQRSRSTLAPCT